MSIAMKKSEKNLLILLVILAVVMGGSLLAQRLYAWQKKVTASEEKYRLAEMESRLLLQEESYWQECARWLDQALPKAPSELEANQALLGSLQESAAAQGVSITKTQIDNVEKNPLVQQYGVTLAVKGELPNVFRWIHAQQSPESFCVVPMLRIASTKEQSSEILAQVQFWRWYDTKVQEGGLQ